MRTTAILLALLPSLSPLGSDAPPPRTVSEPTAIAPSSRLAPVGGAVASTHGPFEAGDCAVCHGRGRKGGAVRKPVNDLCFDCHDEFKGIVQTRKMKHAVPREECTRCHNPHNSARRSLLL